MKIFDYHFRILKIQISKKSIMVETVTHQDLSIWLSQPHFMAGETLNGAVCLNQGVEAGSELVLYFRGVSECDAWSRCVHQTLRYMKNDHPKQIFAEIKIPLAHFSSQSEKHKEAYKFTINLPSDLP